MLSFYVVTDLDDPGSCHSTWEEAAEILKDLDNQGIKGIIFGPGCLNEYPEKWVKAEEKMIKQMNQEYYEHLFEE